MTKRPQPYVTLAAALQHTTKLWIQAPLPFCLNTLPKLVTIEGPGSGRQGPSPSAPPGKASNE